MTRALIRSNDSLPLVAGRPSVAILTEVLHEAGFEPSIASGDAPIGGEAVLVVCARFPALSAETLRALADNGDPAALVDERGVLLAAWRPLGGPFSLAEVLSGHEVRRLSSSVVALRPVSLTAAAQPAPAEEAGAVDDLWGLATAERTLRARHLRALAAAGVRFVDPERTTVDLTVAIGEGSVIWPNATLLGSTALGARARVEPGCWLRDVKAGAECWFKANSYVEESALADRVHVGPMAHLRGGTTLADDVRIGNFVECKNAALDVGVKAQHLAYLGDATVGAKANIGAGTITCNYDGFAKHRTEIGAGAFIGSNSSLVAPIRVGAGAITGAGSVISKEVPDDALAVERTDQRNFVDGARRIRERNAARSKKA